MFFELALLLCSLSVFYSWNKTAEIVSAVASVTTPIISLLALSIAKKEYARHKQEIRIKTFANYNERYSNDASIKKVLEYLIDTSDNKTVVNKPTKNEKEMFLRFFEEVEILIEEGLLETKMVKDLLSYYALKIYDVSEYKAIFDYEIDPNEWGYFSNFIKRMKSCT